MSRLFLIFLIVLLPLRGWTAERMVFQMDQVNSSVSQQPSLDVGMNDDCPMHAQMTAQHDSAADHSNSNSGCQSCQLCMPLAALDAGEVIALSPIPHAAPVTHTSRFASADSARYAKPPIS